MRADEAVLAGGQAAPDDEGDREGRGGLGHDEVGARRADGRGVYNDCVRVFVANRE